MTNIIKCTIKKSLSVTKKLAKWTIISAGILAGFAVVFYFFWFIREFLEFGCSILASIPWFVWIIIGIPCSIVVYSYLWCYNNQHPGFITSDVWVGLQGIVVGFIGFGIIGGLSYVQFASEFLISVFIFVCLMVGVLGAVLCYLLVHQLRRTS